jgi:hypothetical protein
MSVEDAKQIPCVVFIQTVPTICKPFFPVQCIHQLECSSGMSDSCMQRDTNPVHSKDSVEILLAH